MTRIWWQEPISGEAGGYPVIRCPAMNGGGKIAEVERRRLEEKYRLAREGRYSLPVLKALLREMGDEDRAH